MRLDGWRWARLVLLILLGAAVVSGCTLSTQQIRRGERAANAARQHTVSCPRADHCAQNSPLYAQAQAALAASTPTAPVHYVTLLDKGETALAARLNLIHAARHSIDVQTYIWDFDDAGNLMLDALVAAARRGVDVRILADQLFAFPDLSKLTRLARTHDNLALRLYNPTFHDAQTSDLEFAAGVLCCFTRINQRMHNKLLLVDDRVGITGGRNYENRYFGWGDHFDYRDRDVLVGGPAAHDMADTFRIFWNHPRSTPLVALRDVNQKLIDDTHPVRRWKPPPFSHPARVQRVRRHADDPVWLRRNIVSRSQRVAEVEYFSDLPAKTDNPKDSEAYAFTHKLISLVANAKHRIVLQTPYLVISKRARKVFRTLHQQDDPPRIRVSTNSLASTDAFYAYAMTYKHQGQYLKNLGFHMYELKPHPDNASLSVAPPPDAEDAVQRGVPGPAHNPRPRARGNPAPLVNNEDVRIGLHAKSLVVDNRIAMVGTHNFDPRSNHYNTESGIIVHDAGFARTLRREIVRDTRPENAWAVAPRHRNPASRAIGTVSSHLPWFDLWPFRYTTDYALKSGCEPKPFTDPEFVRCYRPVGDFPGVNLSTRSIYTRLVTGFGFGLNGIM